MVSFSSRIPLLIFCLDDLSIGDRRVLKSPTTMLESTGALKYFSVYLMKLGALTLGTYRLITVISLCSVVPFFSMKCTSLSHLTNVRLKSTLSDISIATLFSGAIGFVNLLPAFHPKPVFLSVNKMGLL
jgi:hypothetical protein